MVFEGYIVTINYLMHAAGKWVVHVEHDNELLIILKTKSQEVKIRGKDN